MKLNEAIDLSHEGNILNEMFNQSYDVHRVNKNTFVFHTENEESIFAINFIVHRGKKTREKIVEVEFGVLGYDEDGDIDLNFLYYDDLDEFSQVRNPMMVFGTVMHTLIEYMSRRSDVDAYIFSGERKLALVYNRMLGRFAKAYGFESFRAIESGTIYFCMVAEHLSDKKMMKLAKDCFRLFPPRDLHKKMEMM